MQVITSEGSYAICQGMAERRRVDTLLVGDAPSGMGELPSAVLY